MNKIKNGWLNGFFRAWEMLFGFKLDNLFAAFLHIDTNKCSGPQILTGFLTASFAVGLLLALAGKILTWLFSPVAAGIAGAVLVLVVLTWCDRCAGLTLFSNMISKRTRGRKMGDILLEQDASPEHIDSGIASAVFSFTVILQLVFFYFIIVSGNLMLFSLITLSSAFTQAYALNAHTGGGAFYGFSSNRERHIFYTAAFLLLLIGVKFNFMMALAFFGGIFLWNYLIKENFIKLAYGKSDESITLYGECAALIASIIAFIYCAGAVSA